MFKIEKEIELPAFQRAIKYPFATMTPGDSFLIPEVDGKARGANHASAAYARFKARQPSVAEVKQWRLVTRRVPGGVRCWVVDK